MIYPKYKVAIVGRANVGKSTLFNKLIAEPKALISEVAGTTRDRHYALCSWRDLDFELIDTGGLYEETKTEINKQVAEQAQMAIKEADLILFIVDVRSGLTNLDQMVAKQIRKLARPTILVVNKVDSNKWRHNESDFFKLNFEPQILVSASNGIGTGDLLDSIVTMLKKIKKKAKKKTAEILPTIRVAIVGKPNVGKSSLINALLGEKRLIVSPIPHTTRDSQDIELFYENHRIILVDTAGMRRHATKSADYFEKQAIAQSLNSIRKADITILMTDVESGLTWQDKHLIDEAMQARTGIMILANKWDLIEVKDTEAYKKYYQRFFAFARWVPLILISAARKTRLDNVLQQILAINVEKHRKITDNALDKLLKDTLKRHKPVKGSGNKYPYIYSIKQTQTNPPAFTLKTNFKSTLHHSYLKFIENNIRYKFSFAGVPIKMMVAKSQNPKDI